MMTKKKMPNGKIPIDFIDLRKIAKKNEKQLDLFKKSCIFN